MKILTVLNLFGLLPLLLFLSLVSIKFLSQEKTPGLEENPGSNWQTHQEYHYGINFRYPPNYKIIINDEGHLYLLEANDDCEERDDCQPLVDIAIQEYKKENDAILDEIIWTQLARLPADYVTIITTNRFIHDIAQKSDDIDHVYFDYDKRIVLDIKAKITEKNFTNIRDIYKRMVETLTVQDRGDANPPTSFVT